MDTAAKNRSYVVRDTVPVGSWVKVSSGRHAGTTGTVLSYTNAGFRGIETLLQTATDQLVVSAGRLIVLKYR